MIRHIVFFTARRPEDVDAIVEGLSILSTIPHARRLEVRRNLAVDPFGTGPDVVVYGEFDDQEALEAYRRHPVYQESIRRVRPLRDLRLAADLSAAMSETSLAEDSVARETTGIV